jgi:membrane associated rhomboid family serine protease
MLRSLKFCAFLLIDFAVAVIGTAILDTAVRRMIPSHSAAAIVRKEIILSIVCAAVIGFAMWRAWRNSPAKWTWVPAAVWFAFGYLTVAGSTDVWGRLSGFGSGSVLSAPDVRTFSTFTVPLIRATFYSLGAYISSLVYSAPVGPK